MSLNNMKFYTRNNFFTRVRTEIVCVLFFDIVPLLRNTLGSFIGPNKWKYDGVILNLHSSVDFRRFHTLWPQKTNNASLLFHGASWQWSGHVVRSTAQAQTAWSSRPLYDILLRSHFVSRNKIFRCAYFSILFRIKFLLFNDFPSYALMWGGFSWDVFTTGVGVLILTSVFGGNVIWKRRRN